MTDRSDEPREENEGRRVTSTFPTEQVDVNHIIPGSTPLAGKLTREELLDIIHTAIAADDGGAEYLADEILARRSLPKEPDEEALERAAEAILAKVPFGYGMTKAEAVEYARAALVSLGWMRG